MPQQFAKILAIIRSSEFLRHNFIFFVGSVATGALNYLYYPILGRMLSPAAFGEIQAVVSLFLQAGIFLSVLGMITVNIVANRQEGAERNQLIVELEKLALLISIGLLVVTIIFSRQLERFLQFGDFWPFVLLAVAVVVTVPSTFRGAYLRGHKKFAQTAWSAIIGAAAKLVFSVLFVALGFGTTGAMIGIVLAQFVSFLYAAYYARRTGFKESLLRSLGKIPNLRMLAPEFRYAALVLVCSLIVTGLYSIDIVIVKHYFDAHTAGLYAGVAAVARIIYFLTASVSQVLMPSIRMQQPQSHNVAILRKSLLLLLAAGGGATLVFMAVPKLIVGILMGHNYAPYASLLPRLALLVLLVSLLNLFVTYHLALRRYSMSGIVLAGACASGLALTIWHGSLEAIINSLMAGTLVSFTALALWQLWRNTTKPADSSAAVSEN